jgi:UDP-glucose 4-epimerase
MLDEAEGVRFISVPIPAAPLRFLVTGMGGFIGGHLARALASRGEVAPFKGDLRDPAGFAAIPRADVVFHLAAQSSPPESVRDPAGTWAVNATGTLHLLEWARRERVGRVVLVSTAHVYGPTRYSPVDEKHPTAPVTPYGASKLAAEALARAYGASYGLECVVVRPFNVYGPGQGRGFLVPDVLGQIHEGSSLVLGNPAPVRDFTFVDDAVDLLVRAGTAKDAAGGVFNLGSGVGHSVDEVARTALRVAGSPLEPRYDPSRFRAGETKELVVDNRHARETLGWAPRIGLEDGLRRTWEAMRA